MDNIIFEESSSSGYKQRTIENAKADISICFAINFQSGGEILTKKSVIEQGKKYVPVNAYDFNVTPERVNKIVKFINKYSIAELRAEDTIQTDAIKFTCKDKENPEGYFEEFSNFIKSNSFIYDDMGLKYTSVEACYQAQKTTDKNQRLKFTSDFMKTQKQYGSEAKKEGQKLEKRYNWEDVKYEVMRRALVDKFKDKKFENLLLSTGDKQLIEWTWWNDKIWGKFTKDGKGSNALGKLLMEHRTKIINKREYTPDNILYPAVTNHVRPEDDGITHINVYSKGKTELGRLLSNFAHTPIILDFNCFESIESWWYWIKMNNINDSLLVKKFSDEELETVKAKIGAEAKSYFRSLYSDKDTSRFNPTKEQLKEIYIHKLNQNLSVKNLLKESNLPFSHYYIMFDKKINADEYLWTAELWQDIKQELFGFKEGILPSGCIFCFGSNQEGAHGKGAALVAKKYFGAIPGQANGLMGLSYGIITKKNWRIEKSSTLQEIGKEIQDMLLFAKDNQQLKFYITKIGSSLAGYTIKEIKSLFEKLKHIISDNVILPKEYEVRLAKSRRDVTLNIAGNGIYTLMKAGSKITQEQLDKFVYEMLQAIINHPEFAFNVKMIRSGGQSGGDLSGNRAALKLGIPTKVLAPKGWLYREIEGIDISDEVKFKERFKI